MNREQENEFIDEQIEILRGIGASLLITREQSFAIGFAAAHLETFKLMTDGKITAAEKAIAETETGITQEFKEFKEE